MYRWSTRELDEFLLSLREDGYDVLGPVVRDQAIVYDRLDALPVGVGDEQAPGRYRLVAREDQTRFGYNLGPPSWKQFLFPPVETVFEVVDGEIIPRQPDNTRRAFIGVRACELAAIEVQDRVFLQGQFEDTGYRQRRDNTFIVAVNCSQAASTCFCTASDDGPAVRSGADVVLTEVNPSDPWYLVVAQSPRGQTVLDSIAAEAASPEEVSQAEAAVARAAEQISRTLPRQGLRDELYDALEHPHWDDVAARCLGCANCTQVCPTCFCSTTREVIDPQTSDVSHDREWDSCFNAMHSYTYGSAIHKDVRSRYRQWLTHKLAGWEDQYGVSGCTGCGRCISWCPVGIDITEEVRILRVEP